MAEWGQNVGLGDRLEQRNESSSGVRSRKVKREYAEYLNEIRCKRLKFDFLRFAQIIESLIEPLAIGDCVSADLTEVQGTLDKIHSTWQKYVQVYEEYSQLVGNTSLLERIGLHRQDLERKVRDCKRAVLDRLNEIIENLRKNSIKIYKSIVKDVHHSSISVRSRISASRSSKSRS